MRNGTMRSGTWWTAVLLSGSIASCTHKEKRSAEAEVDARTESETHADDAQASETAKEGMEEAVEIPAVEKVTVEGMPGATKVGEDLFGGQPTEAALAALKAEGYKTVISTRAVDEIPWDEKAVVEGLGMKFVQIPMPKPIESIEEGWVEAFDEALADAEHPIVFHCGTGNRVLGLWSVWMVDHEGADPSAVLTAAEAAGLNKFLPTVQKHFAKE